MEARKPIIEVVCAVIRDADGRVLAARRPPGSSLAGQWEFPGGKIEAGESAAEALRREIREELGCDIEVGSALAPSVHEAGAVAIHLHPFAARVLAGVPTAIEHSELRWVTAGTAAALDWAEADRPIVAQVFGE